LTVLLTGVVVVTVDVRAVVARLVWVAWRVVVLLASTGEFDSLHVSLLLSKVLECGWCEICGGGDYCCCRCHSTARLGKGRSLEGKKRREE